MTGRPLFCKIVVATQTKLQDRGPSRESHSTATFLRRRYPFFFRSRIFPYLRRRQALRPLGQVEKRRRGVQDSPVPLRPRLPEEELLRHDAAEESALVQGYVLPLSLRIQDQLETLSPARSDADHRQIPSPSHGGEERPGARPRRLHLLQGQKQEGGDALEVLRPLRS